MYQLMKAYLCALLLWPCLTLAQSKTPNFRIQVVDNKIDIGYGLAIGDVDGDKLPDILLADQKDFVWYKNPGNKNGNWARYIMARNLTPQDNVCIAARDLDGDGKVEVAIGAGWNPAETSDTTKSGAVFYLNRPADPTQQWEAIRLPHEVTTHRMRWARLGKNNHQLIVVPLHGRHNKNGEGAGVRIWGYEFPKDPRGPWPRHLIDSTMHMTHNLEVWEKDYLPHPAIIVGGKEGTAVYAWRNKQWNRTESNDDYFKGEGVGEVKIYDEGIAAIMPMHGNQLKFIPTLHDDDADAPLIEMDDDSTFQAPTQIADKLSQGHALVCGDFLKMERDQIIVGWRNPNAAQQVGVRIFVPQPDGRWIEQVLNDSVRMACEDLQAADLDGDGDLDLIASGRATLNVLIYWNEN